MPVALSPHARRNTPAAPRKQRLSKRRKGSKFPIATAARAPPRSGYLGRRATIISSSPLHSGFTRRATCGNHCPPYRGTWTSRGPQAWYPETASAALRLPATPFPRRLLPRLQSGVISFSYPLRLYFRYVG
ncbi:hypothetical protein L596_027925 [Steinernema carpocapsae]|uniref:Uncharacterized protein n=1 Tax=Steinernema carpocapsae TaxID=34508 RepID=A0A4U5LX03_STECR|nr:hypothetical protein L596_027925 [Steinernema carpocapsae]